MVCAFLKQSQPSKQKKMLLEKLKVALTPSWDTVLVTSCVIALSVDPLFFYIPIINEENKCLGEDKNVRAAALLLRTVTDIVFVVNIYYQIKNVTDTFQYRGKHRRVGFAKELARKMPWLSITVDILALLPIPQVLMAVFFKMRSRKYLGKRKIIDVFLLAQYLPRVYRMHHSSKMFMRRKGVLTRGVLYFFLYVLASHVLGAFWYFFSIQRETSCWHKACMKHSTNECSFYCDQDISSRNMTFINSLDEFCLVDVPVNATTPFDFGIFLDSLKNGNTGQIDFAKKFFYSFWWGLRNLSNFGTNLETSTYMLENCFAILISIVGLLLFLYLIGHLEAYILMENEKSEERRKMLLSRQLDIQIWMERNGLHKEIKIEINNIVRKQPEKFKVANLENIFNVLPPSTRISLKRALCMNTLHKVVPLRCSALDDNKLNKVLMSICDFLKPVMYPDDSFVLRMGEPLDRMLLITKGQVWVYYNNTTSSSIIEDGEAGTDAISLGKGAYYGDELLSWALDNPNSSENVPMLKANVKCQTKVEGFVLTANDLKVVVDRYKMFLNFPYSKKKMLAIQHIQKAVRRLYMVRPRSRNLTEVVVEVRSEDTTTA